jgi:hypothetical protein
MKPQFFFNRKVRREGAEVAEGRRYSVSGIEYSLNTNYQNFKWLPVTDYRYRLPITDYRLLITDYPFQSFLIAAIPGRFFPSIYSSMAPPPVDT